MDTCSRLQERAWGKVKWFQMEVKAMHFKKGLREDSVGLGQVNLPWQSQRQGGG